VTLKGQTSEPPIRLEPNIANTAGDAIYSNNR